MQGIRGWLYNYAQTHTKSKSLLSYFSFIPIFLTKAAILTNKARVCKQVVVAIQT
jgi:uncharacterized membrane protein YGL010W